MKNRRGFTLVEMMCVVAIIIFLSAVTITGFSQYTKRAKDMKASVEAHSAAYVSQENQIKNLLMTTREHIQHPTTDTQPHYNQTQPTQPTAAPTQPTAAPTQPTTPPTQPTQPTTPPTQATEPTTQPTAAPTQPTTPPKPSVQPGSQVVKESWGPNYKVKFSAADNGVVKLYVKGGNPANASSWYNVNGVSYDASTNILTIEVPSWANGGAEVGIVVPGADSKTEIYVIG